MKKGLYYKSTQILFLLGMMTILVFGLTACKKDIKGTEETGGTQQGRPDDEAESGTDTPDTPDLPDDSAVTDTPGSIGAGDPAGSVGTGENAGRNQAIVEWDTQESTVSGEDGAVMLALDLSYPKITFPDVPETAAVIQAYYDEVKAEDKKDADEFLEWAKEGYENTGEKDFWNGYAYQKNFDVMKNDGWVLSILTDGYSETGGAHPSSFVICDNFDMKNGGIIKLDTMFEDMNAFRTYAVDEMKRQIQEKNMQDSLYPEYEDYLPADEDWVWYLTDDSMVIVFNEYSLAPHAAGILTFSLETEEVRSHLNDYGNSIWGEP